MPICIPLRRLCTDRTRVTCLPSAEERSRRGDRAKWREWIEGKFDAKTDAPANVPAPPGPSAGMSAEVAAAAERQQPFLRRTPAATEATAETGTHVPAEVGISLRQGKCCKVR